MASAIQSTLTHSDTSKRLFLNVLLFIVFFGITIMATFIIRIFTFGLYKKHSNFRFLRKYVEAQNWLKN